MLEQAYALRLTINATIDERKIVNGSQTCALRSEAREKILHSASGASLMVEATNCVRTDSEAFWRLSLSAQANTAASSELSLIRLW